MGCQIERKKRFTYFTLLGYFCCDAERDTVRKMNGCFTERHLVWEELALADLHEGNCHSGPPWVILRQSTNTSKRIKPHFIQYWQPCQSPLSANFPLATRNLQFPSVYRAECIHEFVRVTMQLSGIQPNVESYPCNGIIRFWILYALTRHSSRGACNVFWPLRARQMTELVFERWSLCPEFKSKETAYWINVYC